MTIADFETRARERLSADGHRYVAAGAGEGRTLRENALAYGRWRLVASASATGESTTQTSVLGRPVALPVLVAPVSFQHLAHPDGDLGTARAAAAAGTVMCLSATSVTSPAAVAEAAPTGRRWFQVQCFKDISLTYRLIESAADAGFEAFVFTADSPYRGRRDRILRRASWLPAGTPLPDWAVTGGETEVATATEPASSDWREDLDLIAAAAALPVIVKGVMSVAEAELACDHGAAAVIVSNHGGRHVDGGPATLAVLQRIVEAVGERTEVLIDGGIRSGDDVVKALALGARAVLVGRPVVWALACDGERGVRRLLELFGAETEQALATIGCPSPEAVTRAAVAPVAS